MFLKYGIGYDVTWTNFVLCVEKKNLKYTRRTLQRLELAGLCRFAIFFLCSFSKAIDCWYIFSHTHLHTHCHSCFFFFKMWNFGNIQYHDYTRMTQYAIKNIRNKRKGMNKASRQTDQKLNLNKKEKKTTQHTN